MTEDEYAWLPRQDQLTPSEIERVVTAFAAVGVAKVRITGGEPLLRTDLPEIVGRIAAVPGIDDIALTTNGSALAAKAQTLRAAGLGRVTVSLDTLRPVRHAVITRRDNHAAVLEGIAALRDAGFTGTKLNTVVMRGVNDDELADLIAFGAAHRAEVRFIEYMDVGGATSWRSDAVVGADEVLAIVGDALGSITPIDTRASAPARRYALADGTTFGIVASTTTPFCATCDRSRVTADGMWFHCLYATSGTDLRTPLRAGLAVDGLVRAGWQARDDQGAVDRLTAAPRDTSVPVELLRRDPHLEMHTRGG
jgi:cyclic pyranopterin phosphate synthase